MTQAPRPGPVSPQAGTVPGGRGRKPRIDIKPHLVNGWGLFMAKDKSPDPESTPATDPAATLPPATPPPAPIASPGEAQAQKPTVTPIEADALVSDLAYNMPDVTPGVVDAKKVPVDVNGREFVEGYHAANPDGSPKVDSIGRFYPASTGRPKKAQFADPKTGKRAPGQKALPRPQATPIAHPSRPAPTFANVDGATPAPGPGPALGELTEGAQGGADPDARFAIMAESYLSMAYVPIVSLLGIDAKPDETQHTALKLSLVPVLKLYDLDDVHPLLGFGAVVGGVALAKAEKPTVRERFAALVARFKKPTVKS